MTETADEMRKNLGVGFFQTNFVERLEDFIKLSGINHIQIGPRYQQYFTSRLRVNVYKDGLIPISDIYVELEKMWTINKAHGSWSESGVMVISDMYLQSLAHAGEKVGLFVEFRYLSPNQIKDVKKIEDYLTRY